MKKAELPAKICQACGRRFTWRRKWVRDWDAVRFCSDACRTGRYAAAKADARANGKGRAAPLVKTSTVP